MSINWSLADWFRCISPSATPTERNAALARLTRMLAGDSDRPRPPMSLPGRVTSQDGNEAADASRTALEDRAKAGSLPSRNGLVPSYANMLVNAPYEPGDEQVGAWPRDALERMNRRFAERLERAIASGQEHQPAPPR
jgi:hypothetical protein